MQMLSFTSCPVQCTYVVLFVWCRRESRQLHLWNNTLLPVMWKLSGLDSIGEEFTFSADSGIVAPKSEFTVNIHFRALKASSYKRVIKLDVRMCLAVLSLYM